MDIQLRIISNLIILDTMKYIRSFLHWLPAITVMAIIFCLSSIPSKEMPDFGFWDLIVKKGAHMLGYGILAASYWYALGFSKRRWWLALLFAGVYAITDEYHQSFVPGRHPSWVDALVIDGSGALISLYLVIRFADSTR
jgi:VanZ family protein